MGDRPAWWDRSVDQRARETWIPAAQDHESTARSRQIKDKSWFHLNNVIEKAPAPVRSPSPSPDVVMLDGEAPDSVIKIQIHPTKPQKSLLNKMFGTYRAVYNKLVESSREDCYVLEMSEVAEKYRPISQKHSLASYLPEYHLAVPEEAMESAFQDFKKALKSSMALFESLEEEDRASFPGLNFKTKKDNSSSIELRARDFQSSEGVVRFNPRYFGFSETEGFAVEEKVPELQLSIRLERTGNDRFYLCVPRAETIAPRPVTRACAIDPGVRSFITMYDPDGLTLGVDDMKECIFTRCLAIDRLTSSRAKEPSKRKRYRMGKRLECTVRRVRALIADMHHKVTDWLSKNYDEVLLPSFETQDTTPKQMRISSKTSRALLAWSHSEFKSLLSYKMSRTGGRVIECEEHYTTKTCSYCGRLNHSIVSERVFSCPHCNLTLDRDVNAARNIYLKNEHLLTRAPGVRATGDAYSSVISST